MFVGCVVLQLAPATYSENLHHQFDASCNEASVTIEKEGQGRMRKNLLQILLLSAERKIKYDAAPEIAEPQDQNPDENAAEDELWEMLFVELRQS